MQKAETAGHGGEPAKCSMEPPRRPEVAEVTPGGWQAVCIVLSKCSLHSTSNISATYPPETCDGHDPEIQTQKLNTGHRV